VIIGVGGQDGEEDTPVELSQVEFRPGGVALDKVGDFEVTAPFPVGRLKHAERAGEPDALPAAAVEPVDKQHMAAREGHELRGSDGNASPPGQAQLGLLPGRRVPLIAAEPGKLGDRQSAGGTDDRRLGPSTSQRTSCINEICEVTIENTV
jgi:hypothetical protein